MDETGLSFEAVWGHDTENWRKLGVYESLQKIVARVSYRAFVGASICSFRQIMALMKFTYA